MSAVITPQQARDITRGRLPLIPVEYETAIKALSECVTFDEAKYWDNKADALAAWAKIYHSNDALLKSKRLKLHAYRRMGQLAAELRPGGGKVNGKFNNTGAGRMPGPVSLLLEKGLKKTEASAARRLALLPQREFNGYLKDPKSPMTIAWRMWDTDPVWAEAAHAMMNFRAFCRRKSPAAVATILLKQDNYLLTTRELLTEITEWLDELEQRLPKVKKT